MTRKDIIEMTGSEEQADYAINILLEQVKMPLLQSAIRSKINEIDSEIKQLTEEGYICKSNGYLHVNWNPNLDPDKQSHADCLLYQKNRTINLICVR